MQRICRRRTERRLDEGERVKRHHRNVPIGTKVHLVVAVVSVGKRLCPNWFDTLDCPLSVVKHRVNDIKVDDWRRLEHRGAHDEDRSLVGGMLELRTRKLGGIGEDQRRRLVRRAQRVAEALEAGTEVVVRTRKHDRHAKHRLLEEGRWRSGEQEVHVVLGSVEENLPHALGQLVGSDLANLQVARFDWRAREHHVVDR